MRFLVLATILLTGFTASVYAQQDELRINTPNSVVNLESQDKGILLPRMTSAQKRAISNAVNGLMVYQTDQEKGIYQFNGKSWIPVGHNPTPYQVANGLSMEENSIRIEIPGQASGDMFYYTGTQWLRIPRGTEGQRLCLVNGVPKWVN